MKQGTIYISGVIGEDVTLIDVIKQVKAQSDVDSILVKIDSVGGAVNVGYDVYNYLKNLSIPVTTFITGKCYSIASVIFLAGSTRLVEDDNEKALMIHLPFLMKNVIADHELLSKYVESLKKTEDEMISFYSEAIDIDTTTIHSLLKNETYLNASEALELGFATEIVIAQKAVAILYDNKEEQKEESLMNKLNRKIDSIMNMLSGNTEIKAELILQDANSKELVFPDLEATEVASVDAKVTFDGKPADGDFTMPNGDVITAVKGVVTVITPAEVEAPAEEVVAVEEPEIKAEVIKSIAKWEMDVINTSFELDEILKYTYEGVDYAVGAGEYELADGKRIVTDADGKIVEVKEATEPVEEPATEEVAPVENNNEDVIKMLEVIEAMASKNVELENKFLALAKSIGSDFSGTSTKENLTNVKASVDNGMIENRAYQILNAPRLK